MYLESIFGSAEIARQWPQDAKVFSAVDKQFKDIMKRVFENPSVYRTMIGGLNPQVCAPFFGLGSVMQGRTPNGGPPPGAAGQQRNTVTSATENKHDPAGLSSLGACLFRSATWTGSTGPGFRAGRIRRP